MPYPHFDRKQGWGVNFRKLKKNKHWESASLDPNRRYRAIWHFHAAHSDQGLMYYLVRFVLKEFSVVLGNKLQNWSPCKEENCDEADIESETFDALAPYEGNLTMYQFSCDRPRDALSEQELKVTWKCNPPYSLFAHFSGRKKPWFYKKFAFKNINSTSSRYNHGVLHYYFKELHEINNKYDMGLDVKHWMTKHSIYFNELPLGEAATYSDQKHVIFQNHTNKSTS